MKTAKLLRLNTFYSFFFFFLYLFFFIIYLFFFVFQMVARLSVNMRATSSGMVPAFRLPNAMTVAVL